MSGSGATAYVVIAGVTVAMNAAIAVADVVRARFVLANSAEVGVAPAMLPALAALKAAGAAGVLVGLLAAPALAVAASAGLTAFYIGAVGAHLRAGVIHNIAFPVTFLAFAAATLALAIS